MKGFEESTVVLFDGYDVTLKLKHVLRKTPLSERYFFLNSGLFWPFQLHDDIFSFKNRQSFVQFWTLFFPFYGIVITCSLRNNDIRLQVTINIKKSIEQRTFLQLCKALRDESLFFSLNLLVMMLCNLPPPNVRRQM